MQAQILIVCLTATITISVASPPQECGLKDSLELAKSYAKLIERSGENAWHFLECMGEDWAKDCVQPTLDCIEARDLPGCVALIVCEGRDANKCADRLE